MPYRITAGRYKVGRDFTPTCPPDQTVGYPPLIPGAVKDIVHLTDLLQAMLHYAAGRDQPMQASLADLPRLVSCPAARVADFLAGGEGV